MKTRLSVVGCRLPEERGRRANSVLLLTGRLSGCPFSAFGFRSTDNRPPATGNRRSGFTLIEVIIAMSIFLGAMMVILGLYFQNLQLARMAREEIILAMIQRDVMARNMVVSYARAGDERDFRRSGNDGGAFAVPFDRYGSSRDGTGYGTGAGETTTAEDVFKNGWGIRNSTAWMRSSGLHWGVSKPAAETDVPLYEGFYFVADPILRDPDPTKAEQWAPSGNTPGLCVEDSQPTDWDGYYNVDMDGDGEPETNRGLPYPSVGPVLPSALGVAGGMANADNPAAPGYTTAGLNPFRIFYNSNKMSRYVIRLRVRVMWNIRNENDVYNLDDPALRLREQNKERVFNHTEYYFSVSNPDVVKRWQPKP